MSCHSYPKISLVCDSFKAHNVLNILKHIADFLGRTEPKYLDNSDKRQNVIGTPSEIKIVCLETFL